MATVRKSGAKSDTSNADGRRLFPPEDTLPGKLRAAAVRLFQAQGYEAVTIDDIVAEVGGTKGGFYYYFPSKADLLVALHEEYTAYSLECYRAALEAAGPNPRRQLEAFIHESWRQIDKHPEYVGLLFDERRSLPEEGAESAKASKAEMRVMLAEVIGRGYAEGAFREVDSHAMALAILGMTTWGYTWYQSGGRLSYEDLAAQFADLAWRGLAARRTK
jgi:TetR/AcrR family transcriptional regulator, cholesterol catabolism regulator